MSPSLLQLSEAKFCNLVRGAFKSYHSLLQLSRSPLATWELIEPALVLDKVAPTADDRGRALRVALRWSVNRLAPAPPPYPLGRHPPFDEPSWRDPLWWRYNLLRYSYLEPLQPDLIDILGYSRATDALVNLTGFSSYDALFDERNRAIREVMFLLRKQISSRQGDDELCRMALDELCRPLEANRAARELLGLAATFRRVFGRAWLLDMAAREGLSGAQAALDYMAAQRLLVEGDGGANLMVPPVLRAYVYARQTGPGVRRRHERALKFCREDGQRLEVAWHLQRCGRLAEAADLLLEIAEERLDERGTEELRQRLSEFRPHQLPTSQWGRVQTRLCDLWRQAGEREKALEACRQALQVETAPGRQARLYHWMARLQQDHNPTRALVYYQGAEELFPPDDPARLDLLKDRAWHHMARGEWGQAEMDLTLALEQAPPGAKGQRADLHDALADLYRQRGEHQRAISQAQSALRLREEAGDWFRVADSFNNLGLLYAEMGELEQGVAAYQEALTTYRRLGNREAIATAQLNLGAAFYLLGRLGQALERYSDSLTLCQEVGLGRVEAKVRYNLAETLAEVDQAEQARRHWLAGYVLCQEIGLDDQLQWFHGLRDREPIFKGLGPTEPPSEPEELASPKLAPLLSPEEQAALQIARETGWVTSRQLMDQTHVSKATATRRLSKLVGQGRLLKLGRGRATRYVLP